MEGGLARLTLSSSFPYPRPSGHLGIDLATVGRAPRKGMQQRENPFGTLRLPEELEEQLWSEIQTFETVEHMPYVTSVERIGIRKGIEQGIQQGIEQGLRRERLLLLRQTRKRFGSAVAEQSAPLLDQIENAQTLEDLAEALLDASDGAAWLHALTQAAG